MKMIDVLNMMAKGEIKEGTKLIVSTDLDYFEYRYSKGYNMFFNKYSNRINGIEADFYLDEDFLNLEVNVEQPSEQKYYIKLPHSEFYVCFAENKNNEKEIIPYPKNIMMIEPIIQSTTEDGLKFKAKFTEQDFEEIEELKPYKAFKELVKDDENE